MASPAPSTNHPSAAETALQVDYDQDLRVPYFCEENVWRLAYRKSAHANDDATSIADWFVVFISNATKSVPMFQQRAAAENSEQPCCWDYHVILVSASSTKHTVLVWDMDSRLPYPCLLTEYLEASFPYEYSKQYTPAFRLVKAASFLKTFSSDRMHMFNAETNTWNAPPPTYACIGVGADTSNNLNAYLDFTPKQQPSDKYGQILSLIELEDYNFELED